LDMRPCKRRSTPRSATWHESNGAGPCCLPSAHESGDFIDIVFHHVKLNLRESCCLGMLARTVKNNSAPPKTSSLERKASNAQLFLHSVHDMHPGARIQSNLHELGCLVCRRMIVNAVPMRLRGSPIHRGAARGSCVVYVYGIPLYPVIGAGS
jgi:hypothetical protein